MKALIQRATTRTSGHRDKARYILEDTEGDHSFEWWRLTATSPEDPHYLFRVVRQRGQTRTWAVFPEDVVTDAGARWTWDPNAVILQAVGKSYQEALEGALEAATSGASII